MGRKNKNEGKNLGSKTTFERLSTFPDFLCKVFLTCSNIILLLELFSELSQNAFLQSLILHVPGFSSFFPPSLFPKNQPVKSSFRRILWCYFPAVQTLYSLGERKYWEKYIYDSFQKPVKMPPLHSY